MKRVVHRNWRVHQSEGPEKEEWEQWQAVPALLSLFYLFQPHTGEDKSALSKHKSSPSPALHPPPLSSPLSSYHVDLISHTFSSFLSSSRPPPLWLSSPCKRDAQTVCNAPIQTQTHIVMRQWPRAFYHLINQVWVAYWGCTAASFGPDRSSLCKHHADTHTEANFTGISINVLLLLLKSLLTATPTHWYLLIMCSCWWYPVSDWLYFQLLACALPY